MPVCGRCGETSTRCACFRSATQDVKAKPLLAPDQDRWQQKYSRSPSPTVLRSANSSSPPQPDELFTGTILDRSAKAFACATCARSFVADETLYPGPVGPESYRCRGCFAEQCSKGSCAACGQDVLGDVPFTRAGDHLWHNTCWACAYCRSREDVSVDLGGRPACGSCYDSAAYKLGPPRSPTLVKSNAKPANRAVDELRAKLVAHGFESAKPAPPRPPLQFLPQPASTAVPAPVAPKAPVVDPQTCSACAKSFVGALRVVSLPSGQRFHSACFKCDACKLAIIDREFVELDSGLFAHPACVEDEVTELRAPHSSAPIPASVDNEPRRVRHGSTPPTSAIPLPKRTSARFSNTPPASPRAVAGSNSPVPIRRPVVPGPYSTTRTTLPRLGSATLCPGCALPTAITDSVNGPNGRRWHRRCLVCACGKSLDSAARLDGSGKPSCRACLDAASARRWAA